MSQSQSETERAGGCDAVGLPERGGAVSAPPADAGASENALRDAARRLGETVFGPNAHDSDRAPGPNAANFRALAHSGIAGMALPRRYGGQEASGAVQREITEILASYCGVTTFTQAQHHGPSRMIANGPNETLKARLLPDLAAGRRWCAVSFAHLRRPGPPVLRAEPTNGGLRLNGTTPWVTGWGLMTQVVFGATLPDGRFVYVWVPGQREDFAEVFADCDTPTNGDWGTLSASPPLPLCAMNASATVELTCADLFVPEAHRLSESDRDTMRRNDRQGVLGATAMPLGCATGSLRLLCDTAARRSLPAIQRAAGAFGRELSDLRAQVEAANARTDAPDFFAQAVKLRAHVLDLAARCALAAVAANSGSANSLAHPAQRLYREAMFYAIQAQTQDVMDATLARLERPNP